MASKTVDPTKLQKNIKKTKEDLEYQKGRLESYKQKLAEEQAGENRETMVELYSDWVREGESRVEALEKKLAKYEQQLADAGFDADSLAKAAEDQKLEKMRADLADEQQSLQRWTDEEAKYKALYLQTNDRVNGMSNDDPNRGDVDALRQTYRKKYYHAGSIVADLEKSVNRRQKAIDKIETERAKKEAEARGERYDDGRNVQALRDFLDQWRDKCFAEMSEEMHCDARKEAREKIKTASKNVKAMYDALPYEARYGWVEKPAEYLEAKADLERMKERYMDSYGIYDQFDVQAKARGTTAEDELKEMLDGEWIRKYDDLLYRIEKHVGKLTDASHLYVGRNGSINGYVEGDTGKKARVETIIAAGPIRKAHYRVIIEPIRG